MQIQICNLHKKLKTKKLQPRRIHGGEIQIIMILFIIQIPLCSHWDARFELQQAVLAVTPCLEAVSCCLVIRFFMLTVATLSQLCSQLPADSSGIQQMWQSPCSTTQLKMFVCYLRWKPCESLFYTSGSLLWHWHLSSYSSLPVLHLTLEILLAGVQFKDSGEFSVQDAELASLRKTRNLKVICEEIVPRKHADILQLISELSNHNEPLDQGDFECTLMMLVYTSQQVVNTTCEWQQQMWEESFVNLYKVIKQDLTDTSWTGVHQLELFMYKMKSFVNQNIHLLRSVRGFPKNFTGETSHTSSVITPDSTLWCMMNKKNNDDCHSR